MHALGHRDEAIARLALGHPDRPRRGSGAGRACGSSTRKGAASTSTRSGPRSRTTCSGAGRRSWAPDMPGMLLRHRPQTMPSFTEWSHGRARLLHGNRAFAGQSLHMTEIRRADMHVHSTASELSKLGIQRSLHLPECATPPEEVYELAKRRGMDFVTITDHDTIAGALSLPTCRTRSSPRSSPCGSRASHRPSTCSATGSPPTTTSGSRPTTMTSRPAPNTCTRAGSPPRSPIPFYAVEAPLTARHRRRLAQLFPIWETRNGSRAKELNLPAFVYIETHGGTAIGGSDDHAGIDIGRTFTETPPAATPEEFLAHIRAGRADAHGAREARRSGPTPRCRSRSARSGRRRGVAAPTRPRC